MANSAPAQFGNIMKPYSPLAALGQTLDATKLTTGPALVHSGSTAINRIRA